jgi:P27 family predicted phage terminase small subunit
MPSPKPRPTGLKILEGRGNGRDSGGRQIKTTPGFTRLPPEPPEFLTGPAREMWDQVVPELQRLQLLKPIDQAALTALCLAWERLCQAQHIVERDGMVIEIERGPVKNPAIMILEAASKELRAWSAEFGLTPSAEGRLGISAADSDADDDDNPFG